MQFVGVFEGRNKKITNKLSVVACVCLHIFENKCVTETQRQIARCIEQMQNRIDCHPDLKHQSIRVESPIIDKVSDYSTYFYLKNKNITWKYYYAMHLCERERGRRAARWQCRARSPRAPSTYHTAVESPIRDTFAHDVYSVCINTMSYPFTIMHTHHQLCVCVRKRERERQVSSPHKSYNITQLASISRKHIFFLPMCFDDDLLREKFFFFFDHYIPIWILFIK